MLVGNKNNVKKNNRDGYYTCIEVLFTIKKDTFRYTRDTFIIFLYKIYVYIYSGLSAKCRRNI